MAWQWNHSRPGAKNQNLFKDFVDSTLAGLTNQTPAWKIQERTNKMKASADATDKRIASIQASQIAPPAAEADYAGSLYDGGYGGGYGGYAAKPVDPDAGIRSALKNEIAARGGDIEGVYNSLFADLDTLLRTRDNEIETQYGDQFKKASDTYAAAIPEIQNSYAAIGSADSTDNSDAKSKAKAGFEETTKTIGKNKAADKAKLGAYGNENRAKLNEDRESARRNVNRAKDTTDVSSLRSMRNDLESNIGNANVTRATLGTDGKARQDLKSITGDNGRFKEATNALDSIIKSSMSGSVKEAAVKAVADNSGLSDDEKKKVNEMYGNVYAEQSAL